VSKPDDALEKMRQINRAFMEYVPHNKALGIQLDRLGEGEAEMTLPYQEKLVGNPDRGILHGGAITTILDACSGAAVFMALETPQPIATLDLRIDYLEPATPHQPVHTRAHCYRLTRNVAFTRAVAYHDDPDHPIATSAGTFMVGTKGGGTTSGTTTERGEP